MPKSRPSATEPEALARSPGSWEEATAALEALLRRMESGTLSLEESIKAYQQRFYYHGNWTPAYGRWV
ncbi:MAG: exodeoxyribonuclease VII small subunit, partial [Betaproteobacteria bacterium]|nr:exodeoxyribonuclease VII small subunit [Betaproteobacteria bacterium]